MHNDRQCTSNVVPSNIAAIHPTDLFVSVEALDLFGSELIGVHFLLRPLYARVTLPMAIKCYLADRFEWLLYQLFTRRGHGQQPWNCVRLWFCTCGSPSTLKYLPTISVPIVLISYTRHHVPWSTSAITSSIPGISLENLPSSATL